MVTRDIHGESCVNAYVAIAIPRLLSYLDLEISFVGLKRNKFSGSLKVIILAVRCGEVGIPVC
jgi:hypothetical protein